MQKNSVFILLICITSFVWSQDNTKPPTDLRSHNLATINSSLLNPATSLVDGNKPQSIALWSRWQWQTIDTDPTTLFINYNRQLTDKSAMGVAFFQNNTGLYLNKGAVLNYAHLFAIDATTSLTLGVNFFAYGQEISDEMVVPPVTFMDNSIIAQFSPGIKLQSGALGLGFAAENAFDYNFNSKESNTQAYSTVYTGIVSYDVPLMLGAKNATLQPSMYLREIQDFETQYGVIGLLDLNDYWAQLGYNNYYGFSAGVGGTVLNSVSLGALVEFGSKIPSKEMTLEIVAAYTFGAFKIEEKVVEKEPVEEVAPERFKKEPKEKPKRLSKREAKKQLKAENALAQERKNREYVAARQAEVAATAKRRQDSIASLPKKLEEEEKEVAQIKQKEPPSSTVKVTLKAGEKYEESKTEDGLEPGFYLIANVYKTKTYFTMFMNDLKKKGLQPKSFHRNQNGLNYIYLKRYNTMEEARKARNTKFNGAYSGDTWIFRVIGK